MNTNEIKLARPEDIPQIVAFGYKSFKENSLEDFGASPDFDKTTLFITELVMSGAVLTLRSTLHDAILDGVFVIKYDKAWWSIDPVLRSILLYIKEDKRTYQNAVKLLKAGQEYAIMEGMPLVVDLISKVDTQRKKKLIERQGFEELGSFLVFNPKQKE